MNNAPPVSNRVHIFPLGFEYARLKEPIFQWKADIVVPIEYRDSDHTVQFIEEFLAELEENDRIEVDKRSCDIFDLYDTLGTISKAIMDYSNEEVFVNLSAGSKITAIAGMIACMATGARPIYARPSYKPEKSRIPDEPLHDEVAEVFELPRYPIERPSDFHISFLAFIDERTTEEANGRYRGVSKKELIEFALDQEFPFIIESEASTEKGYYRLLDRHVVKPLQEKEYLEIEKIGRKKYVTLTEDGENALRAFRYAVDRIETED
ncbi:HFX_2341 family transcriptional regulator domain-containing protein [Natronococcus occultus]|uniref:Uncharacterized protein n=1 Tax=Natronococcus occultus SP4 TaxID=694430 RepID=L0JXX0_9EURY|nr:DUF6293 family protein [Natronococcus occultus]AGB36703.1 hypothetical protein Natoc_0850 [Natronococcus occultus SP4]